MLRKRTLVFLALITVLPMVFVSCVAPTATAPAGPAPATVPAASGGQPAAPAATAPAAAAPGATAAPTSGITTNPNAKRTLRIEADAWVIQKFPMQDAANRFMKDHPDVQVTLAEKAQDTFAQKYLLDWSSGKTTVDLGVGGTEGQLAALAAKNLLVSWDDVLTGDLTKDKFVPAFLQLGLYNGQRLSLPFMGEIMMFSVNKDMMKAAGLTDANGNPIPPKTMSDIATYCQKTTQQQGGKTTIYGCSLHVGFSFATYNYLTALQATNGTIFGPDGKTVDLESQAAIDWLTLQQNLAKNGYGFTGTTTDDDAGRNGYKAGKIAIILEAASRFVEGQGTLGADKASVMAFPGSDKNGTIVYAHHVFIPKLSPSVDLAKQFVREQMMQPWFSQWSYQRFGKLPVIASFYQNLGPEAQTMLAAAQKSATAPLYRDYNQMDTLMQQEFQKCVLGQQTPQQTLQNLKNQIGKLDLTNLASGQ